MTLLAFVLHIAGGASALLAGVIAICARKGGSLHRKAGVIFVLSTLVMAPFAIYLAVVIPGQFVNVLISIFALYFIGIAWLAVWRRQRKFGLPGRAPNHQRHRISGPDLTILEPRRQTEHISAASSVAC